MGTVSIFLILSSFSVLPPPLLFLSLTQWLQIISLPVATSIIIPLDSLLANLFNFLQNLLCAFTSSWACSYCFFPQMSLISAYISLIQSLSRETLRSHGLSHTRLPCPSPAPGVCSNSCPSRRWWHPNISSSVVPFSSCPQSFPASGSFPVRWLFTSGLELQH